MSKKITNTLNNINKAAESLNQDITIFNNKIEDYLIENKDKNEEKLKVMEMFGSSYANTFRKKIQEIETKKNTRK